MAAVALPGPTQAPPSQNEIPGALNTLSWEGDKMFNIYIYDYCFKRGFRKTARELLLEAEIAPDAMPPIDARQGLLFEWWSVFWVLFQAKSGGGSEDALVYTQHQAQRLASQRLQPPGSLSSTSGPPGSQSTQPPLQPQQGQQLPQQMGRFVNGITRPGFNYLTNGQTPNGIMTGIHGHPQFQSGVSFSVGPPPPPNQPQQPNGVPGGPGGPQQSAPGGVNPNPPMQFNSLMPGQQQQRQPPPLMNGHPQQPQQRGPGPFQSPTMAHSPQNNAGTPGQLGPSNQPQQGQQQQGQPPMGQFGGPSPNMAHAHMNRTDMLPPNGSMNPMGSAQQQQQLPQQAGGPPTPGYSQQQQQQQQGGGGRPPSRTNTPAGMMHSSPSLASRQTPGGGMGPGASASENNINAEILRIPTNIILQLKRENGFGDKDLASLTMPEKSRLLQAHRNRPPGARNPNQKPGQQDNNATAGPSTGIMQAPGQQAQRGAPQQPQLPQQRNKRNSTSPGEEHEMLPRNDASPPERKRVRRSPAEQQPSMQQPIPYPHHPQQQQQQGQGQQGQGQPPPQQQQQQNLPPQQQQNQPGQPMTPQMMHNQQTHIMMLRQMGMNGQIGPPPSLTGSQPQIGPGPGSTPMINNPMMHGTPGGMHAMYRRMNPPNSGDQVFNPAGVPPGVGGGPGPQFNPGGLNRMGQNKPGIAGSMMPPPSPATNGAPKDGNGGNGKDAGGNKGLGPGGNNNPGSPRNQSSSGGGGGGGGGTAPPTPVPGSQSIPQQQQQQQQQQMGGNQNSLNPSPAAMMGVVPTGSGPGGGGGLVGGSGGLGGPQTDLNMFSSDFMSTMTTSLDDFAGTADLFGTGPDGEIDFERDYAQWFNPDDVGPSSLEMK